MNEPGKSACAADRHGHEDTSLLQSWANPRKKARAVIRTKGSHAQEGVSDNVSNITVAQEAPQPTRERTETTASKAGKGVVSIKLDSELQVGASLAKLEGVAAPTPGPTLSSRLATVSHTMRNTLASALPLSASSLPALIHKTAVSEMHWCLVHYRKYQAASVTLLVVLVAATVTICVMTYIRRQSNVSYGRLAPRIGSPTFGSSPQVSRQSFPMPRERPPQLSPSTTSLGGVGLPTSKSPVLSTVGSGSMGGHPAISLNSELVLPEDKEVLLAVPSVAITPQGDSPVEYPIANKDGAPILRVQVSRRSDGETVRERLDLSLWEDSTRLSFCEISPEKVKRSQAGHLNDAVVGSIFRSHGELFANIVRHSVATPGTGLPVGEFRVSSASGPSWQFLMTNKGRELQVTDRNGTPHGMVMSGVDLSFENEHVQYYQLHALAGSDVCLLLMTVMSIDRLTLLSKA